MLPTDKSEEMVKRTLEGRDIRDPRVLDAMRHVPRHLFVPENLQDVAYSDQPLPIGHGQTISQPYMVAFMAQAAQLTPTSRALEIGTGCGYSAAILSRLCAHVYTIEIVAPLADEARERLQRLGYDNVTVCSGDGSLGWPEEQPFDAIVVTAAAPHLPPALLQQLAPEGRLVIPVGGGSYQLLQVIQQRTDTFHEETLFPVRFVPMTGQVRERGED